ncbi:MAG: hypothetical protein ACRDWV_11485 [Acidimicrobiales bacterium]
MAVGRCGITDQRTRLVCVSAHNHAGSCQFVSRDTVAQVLEFYEPPGSF